MASKTPGSAADLASQAGERVAIYRILFATDFSAASSNAASYAKALAHRFSSSVEIAHVFDPTPVGSHEQGMKGIPVKERRRLVEDNLERLKEDFSASGINVQTISPEGHRASVSLLKIVREQRMDLIVVGTRSKSGMERQLFGSTAEQLVRNAACPVLTVGPHAKQPPPLFFERIVYATDFLLKRRELLSTRFCSRRIAEHIFMSAMCSSRRRRGPKCATSRRARSTPPSSEYPRFFVRLVQPRMCSGTWGSHQRHPGIRHECSRGPYRIGSSQGLELADARGSRHRSRSLVSRQMRHTDRLLTTVEKRTIPSWGGKTRTRDPDLQAAKTPVIHRQL